MKLTWFGETAIRVHIGGKIFVFDAQRAPAGVDPVELLSASDESHSLASSDDLPNINLSSWRPRRARSALDQEGQDESVHVFRVAPGAVLIEALGEPPLLLLAGAMPQFGRWADGSVVVLLDDAENSVSAAQNLLAAARPKLIALGAGPEVVEALVATLRPRLDGTGLVALEPGFALEA